MSTRTGPGRPRSEEARTAVLHAVDDLLVEQGYAAMTMKGIAERAGVGRQTVYRWWATKAEILWEAVVIDARQELASDPGDESFDVERYLGQVLSFLTTSDAGAGYRALVGEAQHDPAVARLIGEEDLLFDAARSAIARMSPAGTDPSRIEAAVAVLVGPALAWVLTGHDPGGLPRNAIADACRDVIESAPRSTATRGPR